MGNPILELSNSANWEMIYNQSLSGEFISSTQFRPIPEIKIPISLENHTIAVYIASPSSPLHWRFAGFINQRISLGLTVGGGADTDAIQPRKIWLNRITLVRFIRLTTTYELSFNIAKWIRDVNIIVWRYTGIEGDSTEELIQNVREDIVRLEDTTLTL